MDRVQGMTAYKRRSIRRFVDYHNSIGTEPRMLKYLLRETYWPYPNEITYGLAYMGAVHTALPLELTLVRDSRS